jgi:basic amino acid/polyamine antiporter, APA family
MATINEAPSLFLRKATGLVKSWSTFDAFTYSFMSVNLVALGMFFSLSVLPFVPSGQVIPAILIAGVFISFMIVTYASLISIMPRAGGDYVWQSRILTPGVAFVLAVTAWWFIIWYWIPIYASIMNVEVLQPLAVVFRAGSLLTFLSSQNGTLVICILTALIAATVVALGMARYAKVQRVGFYVGAAALVVVFGILLFGSRLGFQQAFNQEAAKLFGGTGDTYQRTIQVAAKGNGYTSPGLSMSPFLGSSLLLIPFMCFWLLWPIWGATLYGEVRGAGDFRRVMRGMFSGLWVTIALAVIFIVLAAKTFGWQFFNAADANYWFAAYGSKVAPTIPIWPYPPLLASLFIHNSVIQALIILAFGGWVLGSLGTVFLSSTRVIFAAAFDRLLPERVARVSANRHVPMWALALMLIPSLAVSVFYAYIGTFRTWTLDAVLVITVAFLGTSIAAMVMPWRKRKAYENSAISRYKIAGVPLMTITGGITAVFLGWNLYKWLWPPESRGNIYGVNNVASLVFMGSMYVVGLAIYVTAKLYRKRHGINLNVIYKEIPVE